MGYSVLNKPPAQGWELFLRESCSDIAREVVVSAMGSDGNFYAALRILGKVHGVVVLIEGCAYKMMSEEEGPYYYGAPVAVLDALSEVPGPFAAKWRAKCRYELDA